MNETKKMISEYTLSVKKGKQIEMKRKRTEKNLRPDMSRFTRPRLNVSDQTVDFVSNFSFDGLGLAVSPAETIGACEVKASNVID